MSNNQATLFQSEEPRDFARTLAEMSEAMKRMASVCDYAQTKDDIGFKASDTWAGHAFATRPVESWSPVEIRLAWEILRNYKNTQLPGMGFEFDSWMEPVMVSEEAKADYHSKRRKAIERAKAESEEQEKKARAQILLVSSRSISIGPGAADEFMIKFGAPGVKDPQFMDILAAVKAIPGRKFLGKDVGWSAPPTGDAARAINELRQVFEFKIEGNTLEKLGNIIRADGGPVLVRPRVYGKVERLNDKTLTIWLDLTGQNFEEWKEAIKALPGRKWNGDRKLWEVPIACLSRLVEACKGIQVAEDLAGILAEQKQSPISSPEAIEEIPALDLAGLDLEAPIVGRTLFDHQKEAILRMIGQRKLILAHDMGLGKTFSALVAAKYWAARGYAAIVVCPASLRINWSKEANMVGVAISTYSWAKLPEVPSYKYILIADEAHYMQNLKSARTVAGLALAENAGAIYLLTGTPLKNGRPVNLYPLLKACGHPLSFNKGNYERRYCAAGYKAIGRGRQVWCADGATNLDELHKETRDIMLRKTKAECLDLPAFTRVIRKAELSAAAQHTYDQAFAAMRAEYQRRVNEEIISDAADAIVMINHLRMAGSIAKCETAIEMGQELVETGYQAVYFTEFLETARKLEATFKAQGIPVGLMTGDVDDRTLERDKESFQAGKVKIMIATFKRGGVGHTLTAGTTVILVDRPWTPGDADQAESRLHRTGQVNQVTSYWLQCNGIDEAIDKILEAKEDRIELVLAGKRKTMRGVGGSPQAAAMEIARVLFED